MNKPLKHLILPVESAARELDAKLLLACVAAERGYSAFVGFQNEIRSQIAHIPRGVFIAKGFASRKARFLRILKGLGFTITAWDEEGLVHPVPEIYAKRRISAESLAFLDGIFSWGENYTELIRSLPFYDGTPIHQVGNPRLDLLRSGIQRYYAQDVENLHGRFGRYILFNSNFGRVNSAIKRQRDEGVAGPRTDPILDLVWLKGMTYRRELYQRFRSLIESVARQFPDHQIVLRPHPAEKIESWDEIRERNPNIHVLFEGNVIPWLLGAEVLIHNGCTTAIESILMGKPAVCYQPIPAESPDWELPNSVSHLADSDDAILRKIRSHIGGASKLTVLPAQRRILDRYVDIDEQRLACDRIMDVVETAYSADTRPGIYSRSMAALDARFRAIEKRLRGMLPGNIYSNWHQNKQFPPLELSQVQEMVSRLQSTTGRFGSLRVLEFRKNIFSIAPDESN